MSKINLSEWLDSRGIFKDVEFGDASLQIVSLSEGLVEQLKVLPSSGMMIDFAADAGLSHHRMRMVDDEELEKDIPIIWNLKPFKDAKSDIAQAICELTDIAGIITAKIEDEELAEMEKAEKEQAEKERVMVEGVKEKISTGVPLTDEELDIVKLHDLEIHEDMDKVQSDISAHNNIQ